MKSQKTKESLTQLITENASDDDDESLVISGGDEEEERETDEEILEVTDDVIFRANHDRPKSIYESLDYDVCENVLWEKEQKTKASKLSVKKDMSRWFIFLMIGVLTALVASTIDIVIEEVSLIKYGFLKTLVDNHKNGDVGIPYLYWVLTNITFVFIGSMLVTYVEPVGKYHHVPSP